MSPTAVDQYELAVGPRSALADPLPAIDLKLPDEMAGELQTVEVWGIADNAQVAFGSVTVTPVLHQTIGVGVALSSIICGTPCTGGEVACGSDGTMTCAMGSDGCLAWSPVTACPSDAPDCSNGTCAATCSDECAAGQTECDTAFAVRTCGQFDSDACFDWSPSVACPSGQTCSNGTCTTAPACALDGASCDDGNACTEDDTCASGTCSGTPKCTSAPANAIPTCAADGACGFQCNPGFVASGSGCAAGGLAPMPTPRESFGTAVGPSGVIYAIGGYASPASIMARVEAYDPATNTWTKRTAMPTNRFALAAVTGSDGLIYAIGGMGGSSTVQLATVEAYDPASNAWTTKASLRVARDGHVAVTGADGLIYVIGGEDTQNSVINSVERYNPATDTWSTRAGMPKAITEAAAALGPDGKIYVVGGYGPSAVTNLATYVYDPTANAWTTGPSLAGPHEDPGGASVGSAVVAVGGVGPLATMDALDPSAGTWTARAAMPTARYGLGAAVVAGVLYAIGGDTNINSTESTGVVEAYDAATDTWWH